MSDKNEMVLELRAALKTSEPGKSGLKAVMSVLGSVVPLSEMSKEQLDIADKVLDMVLSVVRRVRKADLCYLVLTTKLADAGDDGSRNAISYLSTFLNLEDATTVAQARGTDTSVTAVDIEVRDRRTLKLIETKEIYRKTFNEA